MRESLKLQSNLRPKFRSNKLLLTITFLLVFAAGFGGGCLLGQTNGLPGFDQALVVKVIDGDTIELEGGARVRYLGIDTPEIGEEYSSEAYIRNKELVEGKLVELQRGKRDKDEYGRLLRYVYADGIFVNADLVAGGYAKAYIFDPDERYSQVLVQLEQYAKMKEVGLWEK